ncbi:Transposon Tf2-6 polyprotein, partial [Nosema granulosis]
ITFIRECRARADLCNKNDKISEREVTDVVIRSLSRKEKEFLMSHDARTLADIEITLQKASMMMTFYQMEDNNVPQTASISSLNRSVKKEQYCTYHKSPFHSTQDCRAKKSTTQDKAKGGSQNMVTAQSESNLNQITAELLINNRKHEFLVDTGSQYNFISEQMSKEYNKSIKPCNISITLADGREQSIRSKLTLRFKLPSMSEAVKEDFFIIKNLPQSGLLGIDLLRKYNYNIDCNTGKLYRIARSEQKELKQTPDQEILNKVDLFYSSQSSNDEMLDPFIKTNPKLGRIKGCKMTLPLKDDIPVHKKPYPVPINHLPKLKEEVKKLENLDIIHESNSNYASPAFTVPKKTGDVRLVVDYRELNKKTVKMGYPFPCIQYSLMDLKGSQYFSQLDLNMGYYQIEVDPKEQHKTAFVLPFGQYEFARMPFGLCNAPRVFQKVMSDKLKDMPFVKIFVDDILIFSKSKEEHEKHLKKVLERLRDEGISVNFTKSSFRLKEVRYLGKIIDKDGIRPDLSSLIKLEQIKVPHNRSGLMKLVGMINWYRDHIPNLSRLLSNITDKLSKSNPFKWDNEDTQAVDKIISIIKEQIKLHHPDISKPFVVETDASDIGLGGVLLQDDKIVGLFSYKLHKSEKNYTTTEKELLAIVKTLQHFRSMVLGSKITVKTDHNNLLFTTNCLNNRAQRWKILLDEFGIDLQHIKGKDNAGADFLSRCMFISKTDTYSGLNKIL